jgi:hypothetical protein
MDIDDESLEMNNTISLDTNNMIKPLSKKVELFGWIGSVAVLTAYGLHTNNVIEEENNKYIIDIINIFGSLNIGVILVLRKVWSLLFIEVVWIVLSVISFIKHVF